jgi:arginine exporter protein ArgO
MRLNKGLKIEGVAITICMILLIIGVLLRIMGTSGILVVILSSPLFVLVVVALLFYWIYQAYKYQKTSMKE